MADFNIRSESVDVEQIMKQIRTRIREKRGVDYTEEQIRELATVRLEKFLDPKNVRSDLMDQFRKSRPALPTIPTEPPPIEPPYAFDDQTLFASHRAPLRFIRKLLKPILKLLFNPNTLNQVLHAQAQFNIDMLKRDQRRKIEMQMFDRSRAEWNVLYYEVLHNLVLETTRNGIELKNMKMRLEALASRLDFSERRVRALEGVVQYRPEAVRPPRDRDRDRDRDHNRDRDQTRDQNRGRDRQQRQENEPAATEDSQAALTVAPEATDAPTGAGGPPARVAGRFGEVSPELGSNSMRATADAAGAGGPPSRPAGRSGEVSPKLAGDSVRAAADAGLPGAAGAGGGGGAEGPGGPSGAIGTGGEPGTRRRRRRRRGRRGAGILPGAAPGSGDPVVAGDNAGGGDEGFDESDDSPEGDVEAAGQAENDEPGPGTPRDPDAQ